MDEIGECRVRRRDVRLLDVVGNFVEGHGSLPGIFHGIRVDVMISVLDGILQRLNALGDRCGRLFPSRSTSVRRAVSRAHVSPLVEFLDSVRAVNVVVAFDRLS